MIDFAKPIEPNPSVWPVLPSEWVVPEVFDDGKQAVIRYRLAGCSHWGASIWGADANGWRNAKPKPREWSVFVDEHEDIAGVPKLKAVLSGNFRVVRVREIIEGEE